MKKIFFLLLIILQSFIFTSFSKPTTQDISITGTIQLYSNEPFTYFGLMAEDNNFYKLNYNKKIQKCLTENRSKKIKCTGYIEDLEKNIFYVKKVTVIK